LNDAELDTVAAGQGGVAAAAGLVNTAVGVFVQDVLNNNTVDILNHNNTSINVGAGVAVAVLGAAANGIAQRATVTPV
jgi:hypothetical protein